MALRAMISEEEHGALAPELQSEYVGKDGQFVLDVTPVDGWALDDVQGLKKVLQEAKEDRAKLRESAKAWEGLDLETARRAAEKLEEMKNWTPDDKVRELIASEREQLTTKYEGEKKSLESERDDLWGQLRRELVRGKAMSALQQHKGNATLLLPHVESQVKVEKDADGNIRALVIDPITGKGRISQRQGSTDPMGIEELVELMKDDATFAAGFEGTHATGTGATGGLGGEGGRGKHEIDPDLDPLEKLKELRRREAAGSR